MRYLSIILHLNELVANFLGIVGAVFIGYGTIASQTGQPWPPIERIALPLSSSLTLFGTAFIAGSIYFAGSLPSPASTLSKWLIAPIVIGCATAALVAVWGDSISQVTINGFSMMGLAGALLRQIPRHTPNP